MKKALLNLFLLLVTITVIKSQTVTDIDGNKYTTVTINGQTWLHENLKVTRLNDGTKLNKVTDRTKWNTTKPSYTYYNTDTANIRTFGMLYNFRCVETGKLCPAGWHVPTNNEFFLLEHFMDPQANINLDQNYSCGDDIGIVIKADTLWQYYQGTDNFNFSLLPAGYISNTNTFESLLSFAHIWTSTVAPDTAKAFTRQYSSNVVQNRDFYKSFGNSIRCLKTPGYEALNVNQLPSFNVYPTAATSNIVTSLAVGSTILVYNLQGCMVTQFTVNSNNQVFDISMLNTGIYILKAAGYTPVRFIKI